MRVADTEHTAQTECELSRNLNEIDDDDNDGSIKVPVSRELNKYRRTGGS
jgi:hypothetical protein